ncbi:tetrapyrrole biosynthesis, uroporphyrinogen III synthase [Mycena alexandri]|uniref:Tetrapyrrole biosynthesis, uroporphyrinogen III synthase n=1 Tax=Mycena alexandri TaxID=1745969 RepID=A0AAD6SY40_9AGAR|nr:tetrapyrrole biosynthesis, uroporphyrinogen III synthase [Mycena alexandri]
MPSVVLLLRTPSDAPDRYESVFSEAGYTPSSVPVLETVFVNLETLTEIVRSGSSQHGGVIVTSGRACEAWSKAVEVLKNEQTPGEESDWSFTPFYVVAIRQAHPNSPFAPLHIRGESSGTSEQLAKFIVSDLESSPLPKGKRLLYLTGDKNRDTLPDILHARNIELSPLQVYQTQGSSSFSDDLKLALEPSAHRGIDPASPDIWWIVFFAPSAAEFVTPFIRHHFDLHPVEHAPALAQRTARIASIGPTTSVFLRDKLSISVAAQALKPTPDDLLQAISAYDRAQ